MDTEIGGLLWLIVDVVFVLVLGVLLAYGIHQWRRRPRDSATRQVSEDAIRKEYHRE